MYLDKEFPLRCCGHCIHFNPECKYKPEEGGWCLNPNLEMRNMVYQQWPFHYSLGANDYTMEIVAYLNDNRETCFKINPDQIIPIGFIVKPGLN